MDQNIHFSLKEIKKSGLNIRLLKFNNVKVDVRRKTEKPAYIELLKKMKLDPLPIGSQKKPKKAKSIKPAKAANIETEVKEIKEKAKTESKISKLEDLEGMEPKYLKKLNDLGIDPSKILDEDFKELAKLISSTQKLIKSWQGQISGEE